MPTLALVGAAGFWLLTPSVEADLSERLRARAAALPDSGWARIEVAGRGAVLAGEAPSRQSRDRVLAALGAVPGLRGIEDRTTLQARPGNYLWSARRERERIVISGHVPDADTGRALRDEARRLAPEVEDGAGVQEGAPASFRAGANAALGVLAGLERGTATLAGATLSAEGTAISAEGYNRALAALRSPPEGIEVGRVDITPPTLQPFTLSLAREGDRLVLAGHVPSERLRTELVAAARRALPEAALEDRLQTALGAPPGLDLLAWSTRALGVLARLDSGRIAVEDRTLSAEGRTGDKGSLPALGEALRANVPDPLVLGSLDLRAVPVVPYTFAARREAGSLLLTGHVPDEAARAELLRAARRTVLGDRLVDRLRLGDGAPPGFTSAATYLLEQLGQLAAGRASLTGTQLKIEGEGLYAQAVEVQQARAPAAAPAGYTAQVSLTVRGAEPVLDAAACARELAGLLERGAILFEANGAGFKRASYGTLDDVARLVRRCGAARVEIAGHLDAEANPEATRELSLRRAQAVRDHLVRAGIDPGRLEAVGHGGTRPLVPNSSEENRARNQRIEFTVKG